MGPVRPPRQRGRAGQKVRALASAIALQKFPKRKFLAFARRSLRDFQAQAPLLNAAEAAASVSADCTRALEPSDPLARAATVSAPSPLARNCGGKTSSFNDSVTPVYWRSSQIRGPSHRLLVSGYSVWR